MVPNFLYTDSILLPITRTTRTQSFTFFENFFLAHSLEITYKVKKVGPSHIAFLLFSISHKVACIKKYIDEIWL